MLKFSTIFLPKNRVYTYDCKHRSRHDPTELYDLPSATSFDARSYDRERREQLRLASDRTAAGRMSGTYEY